MPAKKMKLTETSVKNAAPNAKYWDTEIKGFGLFTGKLQKSFYYQRDIHGKTTRTKLGSWPDTRVADARYEAAQLVAEYATGAVAKRLRDARAMPTLEQATADYLARPKLRSEANKKVVDWQMHKHLESWLSMPLDEITKAHCAREHARIAKTGERGANHVLKSFRSIYNHARRIHDLPECPTMSIEWYPEPPSQKMIDDLDAWKEEVDALENPVHAAFYRFLLFTGLRKEEALSLRWDQVFDDHLHLPETKNGRAFDLPLFDVHHEIIEPMKAYRSDYVFHGKRQAEHLKSPKRIAWSPHAHRRTFATIAATDGELFEDEVGRLLNHTATTVTGRHYIVVPHDRLRKPMGQVVEAFKRKDLI